MNRAFMRAGALCALWLGATQASAAQLVYSFTGTGSALVSGVTYSGAFSAVATGDTSIDYNPDPLINLYIAAPLIVTIGAATFTSVEPTLFFTQTGAGTAGFVQLNPGWPGTGAHGSILTVNDAFKTWLGDSAIGPLPVFFAVFQPSQQFLNTDKGTLTWVNGSFSNVELTAELVPDVTGVPEPASWAMLLIGFGIVGAGARRHRGRVIPNACPA